jgi:hypothetical protein
MLGDTTNVNTGGGPLNMVNSAIGRANVVSDNQSAISDSFGLTEISNREDLVEALIKFQNELSKAKDLPPDESSDLNSDLGEAIRSSSRKPPSKERVVDKLSSIQKILNTLTSTVSSAESLGKLAAEILTIAEKVL